MGVGHGGGMEEPPWEFACIEEDFERRGKWFRSLQAISLI